MCLNKIDLLYIIKSNTDKDFKLSIIYTNNNLYYYLSYDPKVKIRITRNEGKKIMRALLNDKEDGYYLSYENYPFS